MSLWSDTVMLWQYQTVHVCLDSYSNSKDSKSLHPSEACQVQNNKNKDVRTGDLTNSGNRGDNFSQFQFIKNGCLTGSIQTNQKEEKN